MSFLHLLKEDLSQRSLWIFSIGLAVLAWTTWNATELWTIAAAVVLLPLIMLLIGVLLMRRTPWCSDDAFWRTLPITPMMMFSVRSSALGVLVVLPVVLMTAFSLLPFGAKAFWSGLGWSCGISLFITGTAMFIMAIGSKRRSMSVLAIILGIAPSMVVMSFIKKTPYYVLCGSATVFYTLLIIFVCLVVWSAWIMVGCLFWNKRALLLIGLGSFSFLFLVFPFQAREREMKERQAVAQKQNSTLEEPIKLTLEAAKSGWIKNPYQVNGLPEGVFFLPYQLSTKTGEMKHFNVLHDFSSQGSSWSLLGTKNESNDLSNQYSKLASAMELRQIWQYLRDRIQHTGHWVASNHEELDSYSTHHISWRQLSEQARNKFSHQASMPNFRVNLSGETFRFSPLEPIRKIVPKAPIVSNGGLILSSCEIPNSSEINLCLTSYLPDSNTLERKLKELHSRVPKLWGILYHRETQTAYGTASNYEYTIRERPIDLLVDRSELLLRFELPKLEVALGGLDAEKILQESELHLFMLERLDPAIASFEPKHVLDSQ